jgi:hypothetical protein
MPKIEHAEVSALRKPGNQTAARGISPSMNRAGIQIRIVNCLKVSKGREAAR